MNLIALLEAITSRLNHALWGVPMVLLLLVTHLYMTCRTGFIQRKVLTAIRLSLTPEPGGRGDISPFASLTTALASTIGYRQYHRCRNMPLPWRSGCGILVLDGGIFR